MRAILRAMQLPACFALLIAFAAAPAVAADAPRNFVVFFETLNYSGGIADAANFIFSDLLKTGDQLIVYTPARVYGFSGATLMRPRPELVALLQEKLRGDTAQGARAYDQIIQEMKAAVKGVEDYVLSGQDAAADGGALATQMPVDKAALKNHLNAYRQLLAHLMQIRRLNEPMLRQIAGLFRNQPGTNHMIVVYDKELRPVPRREVLNLLHDKPVIGFEATELFAQENPKPAFAAAEFAELCRQVPLTLHFLYISPKDADASSGDLKENSGDMYSAFSGVAEATGGVVAAVAEPVAGLKAVVARIAGGR